MDSNVIKRFGKYIVYTGYILLIFLIVIDIHFLSELHNISVSNLAEFARDKNSLILSIGGTLILVIVLMLYQQLTVNNPLKTFSNKLKELAENDFNSLSTALTEMAQGNLTKSIQLQSMPINYSGNGKVGELVKGLNSIISNMSEAGKEFNNATDTPCKRLFYVGADSYLEGRKCGEAMGKTLNGKGKVIVVLERFGIIGHELRRKGFQTFLEENFPAINIIDVIEGQADINFCYEETKRIINKYHDVDGIYVTFGGTSVAKAVRNLNKNGKIKIICHDVNNSLMEYIVKGEVTATLSQDEFAQGHDPVSHLYNHIVSGWKPTEPRLLTRMDFISKENYSNYWQMGKGLIESDEIKERRAKPIKESGRKIKIAVLGRQGQEFWETLRAGVVSASNKLREI